MNTISNNIQSIEQGIVKCIQSEREKDVEIYKLKDTIRSLTLENSALEKKVQILEKKLKQLRKKKPVEDDVPVPQLNPETSSEFRDAGVVFDPNTEFRIVNKLSTLELGVKDDLQNSTIVTLKDRNSPAGKWTFEYQGNGAYLLRNSLSKKVAELGNNNMKPGGKVLQSLDNGKDSQKIFILPVSNLQNSANPSEEYIIFFQKSGLAWDLMAESTRPGACLQQWTPSFRSSQRWFIEQV